MNSFIDFYQTSVDILGYVPQEYSIIYWIFTLVLIIGMVFLIFSPFILLGKLLSQ